MAVSFLTRLQQTINTALSPEPQVSVTGPVPGSPSTPTSAFPKSLCSQETPTKSALVNATSTTVIADGNTSASTPHLGTLGPVLGPVVVERERGRSPTTPSHLDARLPIEDQDVFSPSDRTITQLQPQVTTLTHLPPGSVVVGSSRATDSTPSTATVRRYERSVERGEGEEEVLRDGEGGMKRRRKKRGVNETLVIVRPPPTSGPKKLMNLQIQLVLDVDRDKRKSKSRSTSVSSTATGSESIALPLDLPSPSILNNPIGGLRRPEMPSRLSTPAPSPPSTPGLGPVPGDSPTGRKTHITIAEPRSASRPGSIVRNVSGNDHKEVLRSATSEHEGVGQSTTPSSSDSEKRQKRRDRRLSRASSVVSQASVTSNVSAVSGISGVSGLSESTSGGSIRTNKRGKRIVPMYNLNVHNVMTTSVTDAGTDEKVAKFLKRAVDIHSIGSLEPAEIWHPYALDNRLPHLTPHQTRSDTGSPEHEDKVWGFNSTPSAAGPSSINKRASLEAPAGLMARLEQEDRTAAPTSGKTKQFFGRLFKKKDAAAESGSRDVATGSGLISPARTSFVASSAERLLSPLSPASTRVFHGSEARNSIVSTHSVVPNQQYASHTFGSYPMVSTAPDASLGEGSLHRPMGYTFTVKKWAAGKGGQETMIAPPSWAARFASTDKPVVGASPEGSEVVFEWSRGKGKSGRLSRTDGSGARATPHGTIPMPIRSSSVASTNFGETLEVPSAESSRPTSMISMSDDHHTSLPLGPLQAQQQTARRSVLERARSEDRMTTSRSSSPAPSVRAPTRLSNHDDGEESDPEDSETPWVCRVYIPGRREDDTTARPDERKSKNRRRDGSDGEGIVVATLYPAPHHPRVIAQVKVSTDYMPVATGIFRAASRSGSNTDSTTTTSIKGDEIMLSEENVKDVVGVTAMWLVVREDFGGLAKKKKAVEARR